MLAIGKDFNIDINNDISQLAVINPMFALASGTANAQLQDFHTPTCMDNQGIVSLTNFATMGIKLKQIDINIGCDKSQQYIIKYQSVDDITNIKGALSINTTGHYQSSMTASSKDPQISQQLANIATKTLSKDKYLLEGTGNINAQ